MAHAQKEIGKRWERRRMVETGIEGDSKETGTERGPEEDCGDLSQFSFSGPLSVYRR